MTPDPTVGPSVDGTRRIGRDLLCVRCGYNLRTLAMAGRCPECGDPVELSVRLVSPAFDPASQESLQTSLTGMAWMAIAALSASGSFLLVVGLAGNVVATGLLLVLIVVFGGASFSAHAVEFEQVVRTRYDKSIPANRWRLWILRTADGFFLAQLVIPCAVIVISVTAPCGLPFGLVGGIVLAPVVYFVGFAGLVRLPCCCAAVRRLARERFRPWLVRFAGLCQSLSALTVMTAAAVLTGLNLELIRNLIRPSRSCLVGFSSMTYQAMILALAAGVSSVVFTAFLMLLAGRMLRAPDTSDFEDELGDSDQ